MDELYEFNGCCFVWDIRKARANLLKHGVAFEQATEAFFDPFLRVVDSNNVDGGESRDALLGMDETLSLLFVVHIAIEDEQFRIISARPATAHERKHYES